MPRVGRGHGRDVLGHPLERRSRGWPERWPAAAGACAAGEIVLLGSLVQTQWPAPAPEIAIEIEALGRVEMEV